MTSLFLIHKSGYLNNYWDQHRKLSLKNGGLNLNKINEINKQTSFFFIHEKTLPF